MLIDDDRWWWTGGGDDDDEDACKHDDSKEQDDRLPIFSIVTTNQITWFFSLVAKDGIITSITGKYYDTYPCH